MASNTTALGDHNFDAIPNCKGKRFGIVVSEYNPNITKALLEGTKKTLLEHEVHEEDIFISYVPGGFELPLGAVRTYKKNKCDVVICLGCIIKGETDHDKYISKAVSSALMNLSLTSGKAFIFGVLTTNNLQQAIDRAGGKAGNKGIESAIAALKMAATDENTATRVGF